MDSGTVLPVAWTPAERLNIIYDISSRWDRNIRNGVASTRQMDAVLFTISAIATLDAMKLQGDGIQCLIRLLAE